MQRIVVTIFLCLSQYIFSQQLQEAEYFWDVDPGNGNGIALTAFDNNFNHALESVFTNNANLPPVGNHVLHIRVKGQDGNWSPAFRKVFRVSENNNTNLAVKITQAEYFWDNDPGTGNGFILLAFDGNYNQALETVFTNNATLPAEGDHILNIRVKAQDGNWSTPFRKVFRLAPNNNSNLEVKLSQGEYYWNVDPGFGNGLPLLAFDGNFNQALETLSNTLQITVPSGLYVLHVRTLANDGNWSPSFRKVIGVNIAYSQKVVLISPANQSVNIDLSPTLVWNQLNQLEDYEFQVSLSPNFESLVTSGTTTNAFSVQISNLVPNTVYYWRVRANVGGQVSLWSDTWSFTTNNSLSIAETELLKQIVVFPNPTNSVLNIKYNYLIGDLKFEIYDAAGRNILKGDLQNQKIDVQNLSNGMYILNLITASQSKYSTQFIKMNEFK